MSNIVVIPCRYGSSRFPGKPLALIAGKSLIERVWLLAKSVPEVDRIIIATDDERIRAAAKGFGAEVFMTPVECRNGSERVHAVLSQLAGPAPQVVVNLQGDAVLTPPWIIGDLVRCLLNTPTVGVATAAVRLSQAQLDEIKSVHSAGEAGGTFVTFNNVGDALYFSKNQIPALREGTADEYAVYRHIGIYAYRPELLARYLGLVPGALEQTEQLEQLRFLEHGIPLRVVIVDYRGRTHGSIDRPSDVATVEKIIKREGELA
ncbi:MAG: 3-deoxy-manno-octulosonate cytidylyltransferase [Oligoflexia bacterium]|nr:3-deoxy-manno-octulosonate cytidylyltransferase [Oligoflexia bacterium]